MSPPASPDARLRERAQAWRDEDPDPVTRAEVDALIEGNDVDGLRDRFDQRLQFGTAGLRGALGAGPNRMNRALVRRATAGVAAWLLAQDLDGPVVIGRDARHGSAEFEQDAAMVLAGAGFEVRLLPRPMPTPVVAFATLHEAAVAGIVITASHNPPQDNGYKLYLGDGAQIVGPVDEEISRHIDAVERLGEVPLSTAGIHGLGEDVLDAYVAAALETVPSGAREVITVYTAMHGVGAEIIRRAFAAAGFPAPHEVVEQVEPDPDFPTVAFPNPEEPGALDLSLALARSVGADLLLANDPDADRLAVAVPDGGAPGGWRALTGDELGCVLADHLLRRGDLTADDVLATTVVSSRLLSKLAAAGGVAYGEALTGFKWVVRTPTVGQRFAFGYEEALGYCVGRVVRDKDGVTAALVASELAAELKAAGTTMVERLHEIARAHGAHVTRQQSIRVAGSDWLERVTATMAAIRATPPVELARHAVIEVEDLAEAPSRFPVPSDVLVWTLAGARAVIRPSGTEAKLKAYAEAVAPVEADGDVEAARARASEVVDEVLEAIAALLHRHGL